MVGFGLLGGAVIGAIGHYGGLLIPLLAGLIALLYVLLGRCVGGCVGSLAIIIGIIMMGVIGLAYPAIVGGAIGYVTWRLAKWGKCRNVGWAGGVGFLSGVIGYGTFALIAIWTSGMIHTTSGLDTVYLKATGTEWWLYALLGLDALIFIAVSTKVSYDKVRGFPFCEDCEEWYGNWQQASFSPNLAESLMQTLESDSPEGLENNMVRVPSDTKADHLVLRMRKCPSCTTSDFQLAANIYWQEVEIKKSGEIKADEKEETWFTTMISAKLGMQLERLLFAKS